MQSASSDNDSDSSFSAGDESDEEFLILPKKKRKKRRRPAVRKKQRKKRHPPRNSYMKSDNESLLFRYNSSHLNYSPSIPSVPQATIHPVPNFQPSPPLYIPHHHQQPEIIEIDTDTFMDSPCDPEPQQPLLDESSEILMEVKISNFLFVC